MGVPFQDCRLLCTCGSQADDHMEVLFVVADSMYKLNSMYTASQKCVGK